jgi:hypothetical protein
MKDLSLIIIITALLFIIVLLAINGIEGPSHGTLDPILH